MRFRVRQIVISSHKNIILINYTCIKNNCTVVKINIEKQQVSLGTPINIFSIKSN